MPITLDSQGWDELPPDEDPIAAGGLLSDSQLQELRRRNDNAAAHPEDSVAWEDVLAATLTRLSSRP